MDIFLRSIKKVVPCNDIQTIVTSYHSYESSSVIALQR